MCLSRVPLRIPTLWNQMSPALWRVTLLFLLFSHQVVSNSLQPRGLQHARLSCPPLSPGVCSNSCPLSQWCHPTISSSVAPFSSFTQSFVASGSFSSESALRIRWPKYWNFSISPSNEYFNEYLGLISFRFDLLAVPGTPKSLLQHHSLKSVNSSVLSLLYGPVFKSVHDYLTVICHRDTAMRSQVHVCIWDVKKLFSQIQPKVRGVR